MVIVVQLLTLLVFLSGCGCANSCYNCDGRRPQVMRVPCKYSYLIDYNPECQEDYNPCEEVYKRGSRNLEPSDFDSTPIQINNYKLQVGDALKISISEENETLVEKVVIAPDGKIYYLILEGVQAEGLTLSELQKSLEEKLSKYYLAPQVSLTPQFISSLSYKILGRVNKPGLFPLTLPVTLRGAIAQAGGLITETISYEDVDERTRNSADLTKSFIVRDGKRLNIDFEQLIYTATSNQNIYLKPNDYIYIHPNDEREVFLLGNVRQPDAVPYYRGMTLMGLLSSGSGWNIGFWYSPNIHRVLIMRGKITDPCCMLVDVQDILDGCALDPLLKAGDIIYVPNKPFRFVRELALLATNAYVYGFMANAGTFYAEERWFPVPAGDTDGQ